jgi:rare lipoprotein A
MNNYKMMRSFISILAIGLFITGCANTSGPKKPKNPNEGRYKVTKDYGPDAVVDVSHVKDAVPKVEALSRGGNRSEYEVLGKVYSVMSSAKGFKEQGGASWYGKKFHGYKTANGDKYDMYGMSAAHKSLPIPTYLRVTNLANDQQVIVRVNDRGPFHKGRIIDLSYAAAAKLDMLDKGTAQVAIEAIDPTTFNAKKGVPKKQLQKSQAVAEQPFKMKVTEKPNVVDNIKTTVVEIPEPSVNAAKQAVKTPSIAIKAPAKAKKPVVRSDAYLGVHYIQVGVYSTEEAAHNVTLKMKKFDLPVLISELIKDEKHLFKVIIGPMKSRNNTDSIKDQLKEMGFPGAHLMNLPK